MVAVAEDVWNVREVRNIVAKSLEQFVTFDVYFRCQECISVGRNAETEKDIPSPETCSCRKLLPLRFKDSFRFLSASLAKLISNLKTKCCNLDCGCGEDPCADCRDKKHPREIFKYCFTYVEQNYGADYWERLNRKLPYCYSYVQTYECLNETELPPKSAFFDKIRQCDVDDEEYEFVRHLWNELRLNMRSFAALYLTFDVLALADIFEDFRFTSLQDKNLDPLHYLTLPSLSFDSALKMTGISVELICDPDLSLFFSRAMRGGICFTGHRHFKANHPDVPDYDERKPKAYLVNWDMNNCKDWLVDWLVHPSVRPSVCPSVR